MKLYFTPPPENYVKNFSIFSKKIEKFFEKYFEESFWFIILSSVCISIFWLQKGLFFYEGKPTHWYDIFINLINYQEFGFVKRAFYNSIFHFFDIDLSLYYHYAITRIFLIIVLYFTFISFVLNFKNLYKDKYKIEILFITALLFLSPGGILIYSRILICQIIPILVYIISLQILLKNQSYFNCIIISILSITAILQHESYILLSIPLLFTIGLHKKLSYFKLLILSISPYYNFFICNYLWKFRYYS